MQLFFCSFFSLLSSSLSKFLISIDDRINYSMRFPGGLAAQAAIPHICYFIICIIARKARPGLCFIEILI